jgi:hypothetical protein
VLLGRCGWSDGAELRVVAHGHATGSTRSRELYLKKYNFSLQMITAVIAISLFLLYDDYKVAFQHSELGGIVFASI